MSQPKTLLPYKSTKQLLEESRYVYSRCMFTPGIGLLPAYVYSWRRFTPSVCNSMFTPGVCLLLAYVYSRRMFTLGVCLLLVHVYSYCLPTAGAICPLQAQVTTLASLPRPNYYDLTDHSVLPTIKNNSHPPGPASTDKMKVMDLWWNSGINNESTVHGLPLHPVAWEVTS